MNRLFNIIIGGVSACLILFFLVLIGAMLAELWNEGMVNAPRLAEVGFAIKLSLITATVMTCVGTNVLAADQFISVALPGRMFRDEYERHGLSRLNLSRTLEDSGTLTSALIPWNTCGAYMSATLGVATFSYAPYAFFNLLCPVIAIIYAYMHIALNPLEDTSDTVVAG